MYSDQTPQNTVNHHEVTVINRGLSLTNGHVVKAISLYSVLPRSVKLKIAERTGIGAYSLLRDMPFPHPGGGWQWFNIPSYTVPSSGTFYLGYYYPSTSNNIIGCNPTISRATSSSDQTNGSYTGFTESSGDVAAMAYSTENVLFSPVISTGIIKPNGSGVWSLLNDSNHSPVNFSSVDTYSDRIEVFFSQPLTRIHAFSITGDETLALARIMIGSSVGLTKLSIQMSDNSGTVNPSTITNTLSNIQMVILGLV